MIQNTTGRRGFILRAAQTLLAAPLLPEVAFGDKPGGIPPRTAKGTPVAKAPAKPAVTLSVLDYGAIGDGKTKDTAAIQETIDRCALFGGGEVVVPPGTYLSGALALRSGVTLRLAKDATLNGSPDMADYPVTQVRWEGHWIKGYIGFVSALDAENIGIVGPGRIVGSPAVQGRVDRKTQLRLPALIEFVGCKNVRVEDCYTQNYGMWSIHPTYCENVTFKNVTVNSGADGIDVDSCKQVVIDGCNFDTTDDCISLKSGRGAEGNAIGRPTEDVKISNCSFVDKTWACIGIGSETSGGIRRVHVEHCKCLGAGTFAIYIKSRPGRGAYIEDISMNDLEVSGAKLGFLRFNILNSGKQDDASVPGLAGIPTIRNFRFTNIHVTDMPVLVDGSAIHPDKPLEGFTLANVTGTCAKGITLANIKMADIRNVKVTGFTGPLLTISGVTGKGLEGAMKAEAAKTPDPIPTPATPYRLH